MSKANLIFTKDPNSYKVFVRNLEQLSVPEIQVLETFVSARNGIFDFNTYTFYIPKRLEFNDFTRLLEHINIDAICEENIAIEDFHARINFGQYKGMQYNELPDTYLLWLSVNYKGSDKKLIVDELKARKL